MKITNQIRQTFYPGEYAPQERTALEALLRDVKEQGGVGPLANRTVTAEREKMLEYAQLWNPYAPLYNDGEYAAQTRWGNLPALSCYIFDENICGFPMMDAVKMDLGNVFYYANDGGDIELFRQIYPGDVITIRSGKQEITDTTPKQGSPLRQFSLYGEGEMHNQNGELVGRGKAYGRNAWMRILEGDVPSQLEQTYEWLENVPPVYHTTETEWEYIQNLWKQEQIRGAEPRYWEDVTVGDTITPVCSGPVSDIDMIRLHSWMITSQPDAYGQRLGFMAHHFSYCRIPGARAVFFNFTARNFILRMVTNWMGDDGFLSGIKWRFQNLFECMSDNQPGLDILNKVPSMAGRFVNRHGMEGDTAICKGEVTAKYEKGGQGMVDISCWAETLDGDIIQVVEATVALQRKGQHCGH